MRRNDISGLQCLALIFLALVVITGARVAWDRWTRPGPLEWVDQDGNRPELVDDKVDQAKVDQ